MLAVGCFKLWLHVSDLSLLKARTRHLMCSLPRDLLVSIPLHRTGFYLICYGDFSSVAKRAASLERNKTQGHIKLISLKEKQNVPGTKKGTEGGEIDEDKKENGKGQKKRGQVRG